MKMKRFVSVLLFVLMILSLTGCMSVRVPNILQREAEPEPAAVTVQAPAAAAAEAPGATAEPPAEAPAEAPQEPPAAEPTEESPAAEPAEEAPAAAPEETPETPTEETEETPEAPAEEPEETPEAPEETPAEEPAEETPEAPEAVPFKAAVTRAAEGMSQVRSLRMDMQLSAVGIALLSCRTDLIGDPFLARMDVSLSAMGEQMALQLYAAADGDAATLYVSADGGVTWEKQTAAMDRLPQAPAETLDLFADVDDAAFTYTGVEEIGGRPALVYVGDVDGEGLKEFLYGTGVIGALGSALGIEVPEQSLLDLGDAEVIFAFDRETGLPVRYAVDMTEVVTNLLTALLGESLGAEGLDLSMDLPTILLDVTLSQFDAVDPIEIPEGALNAPEA